MFFQRWLRMFFVSWGKHLHLIGTIDAPDSFIPFDDYIPDTQVPLKMTMVFTIERKLVRNPATILLSISNSHIA